MSLRKILKVFLLFLLFSFSLEAQKFVHPTDVVKKIKEKFSHLKSYQAEFTILTERKNQRKYTSGVAYYKKGGLVNFSFTNPAKDVIISNGRKMWIYISRLNAVAIQDLKAGSSGQKPMDAMTESGILTIFNRYHYSFDSVDQPVTINHVPYYVLSLREKVASGSFSEMKLYVNAKTYFITKIEAVGTASKKVTLSLKNIQENPELPNSLFEFKSKDGIRSIENPLTAGQ